MGRLTAFEKYLAKRAVTSPWQINGQKHGSKQFRAIVVIPALAEHEKLPETIYHLSLNPPALLAETLILVVVNNRATASVAEKNENQHTLVWLRGNPFPAINICWIDASSIGLELPPTDGVGLARKIGFDLALARPDLGKSPVLISLDADTLVDENYLATILSHFRQSTAGAAVIPFRHQNGEFAQQENAVRRYELYLRSYLLGLELAKSPYAYHAIGSAFACRVDAYVAVSGMNRRLAGEDFYFLQQLQKNSGVEFLRGTVVSPSARCSDRVPFGTGKVVYDDVATGSRSYDFISVGAFKILQRWLEIVASNIKQSASSILSLAEEFSLDLYAFLVELNFPQFWLRLQRNYPSDEQRLLAYHCWFDALRTRQLLTRIKVDSEVPVSQIVGELLAWGGFDCQLEQVAQLEMLEKMQGARLGSGCVADYFE